MNSTCTCGHEKNLHGCTSCPTEEGHCRGCIGCLHFSGAAKIETTNGTYASFHHYQEANAKPKLKMQLILLGESSLYVKVEEVDARWKSTENGISASFATDFFTLYSGNVCELLALPLHRSALRLFKGEVAKTFVSRETRSAWIDDMEDAIKEWSENWAGFNAHWSEDGSCDHACKIHVPRPSNARVEKEERYLIPLTAGVSITPGANTNLTTDFKVIHYTVY